MEFVFSSLLNHINRVNRKQFKPWAMKRIIIMLI